MSAVRIRPSRYVEEALSSGSECDFRPSVTDSSIPGFRPNLPSLPASVWPTILLLMFCQWTIFPVGLWWYILPAGIIGAGIINAYNFMDGINGITGGYSFAVLVPLLLVNRVNPFVDPHLIEVAMISVTVFCFFNFRTKAKCFGGDVGSVSIAYILLFMLGTLMLQSKQLWYLIFLVVYGIDSILTICHRMLLRENIFRPHRKHIYQLMANELKIPHVVVSSGYMIVQTALSLGAIFLPVRKGLYFFMVVILLSVFYILFIRRYYPLHEAFLSSQLPSQKKRPVYKGKHEPPTELIP